ncbi:MAG TPA: DUF4062 domain-containing protein [Thermoanaerobaculia bacterium]|nr:DUF4062 domain-containing protein [Thermoanaerobaculia bacterium]
MLEHPASPVRIYLSSVPGDMTGEREILARVVIPELEGRAAGLGLTVLLVDPEESWDLASRFAEIDTCRLFIGVLGERYGEVAPLPDELRARLSRLSGLGDRSTAEFEIRYSLESPELAAQSFFYLRDPGCLADQPGFREPRPEAAARLTDLQEFLHTNHRGALVSYACSWNDAEERAARLESFASRVLEDLWAALRAGVREASSSVGPEPEGPTLTPEKPLPLHEDVRFSVYKPRAIAPLAWYPLLIFAHLDELSSELSAKDREAIREIEDQAREVFAEVPQGFSEGSEDSLLAIPDEAEMTFVPEM